MKLNLLILSIGLILCSSVLSSAQVLQRQSIDTDLYSLRNTAIPTFHHSYDDYLQYAPAVVMVGMKACTYKSRSGWGRMLVSDAFSVALMAGAVNGIKYSVKRMRPDGSARNSFPSGHTATAFMAATMLQKEYGWRSPWFGLGGYAAATLTGVSRIMNNRHWLSDVVAGAAIGIGAVHLGYFITDKIFKDKNLYDGYEKPVFVYDSTVKHYVAEIIFGRRFIIGNASLKAAGAYPKRGSLAGISTDIPVVPNAGVTAKVCASSLSDKESNTIAMYSTLAGGYYNVHFAKILEFQAKLMGGYGWSAPDGKFGGEGVCLSAGAGLSLITGNNFKIKAFADYESMSRGTSRPWLNSIIVGLGSAWYW